MRAAIALGSNLPSSFGDRGETVREAVCRLAALGEVTAASRLHETAPVGYLDQPSFLNAAVLLETTHHPLDLLHELLAIERAMGRDRASAPAKGPRIIDLDLLLCEDRGHSLVLSEPELTLPHPAMHERAFVLEPLAEIAPDWVHPTLNKTIAELLQALTPPSATGPPPTTTA